MRGLERLLLVLDPVPVNNGIFVGYSAGYGAGCRVYCVCSKECPTGIGKGVWGR